MVAYAREGEVTKSAKARGSKAYGEGDFALASRCFGEAIAVATSDDPDLAI